MPADAPASAAAKSMRSVSRRHAWLRRSRTRGRLRLRPDGGTVRDRLTGRLWWTSSPRAKSETAVEDLCERKERVVEAYLYEGALDKES